MKKLGEDLEKKLEDNKKKLDKLIKNPDLKELKCDKKK
jgi:hypothetical protein